MKREVSLASVFLALTVVGLTSCGTVKGSVSSTHAGDLATPGAVEERAAHIYTQIWGTADQKEAAHFLEFQVLNAPTVACMASAGYEFAPSFTQQWMGWTPDATESTGWMGMLGRAPSAQLVVEQDQEPAAMPNDDAPGYGEALDGCLVDEVSVNVGNPVGSDNLSAAFHAMINGINDQLGPISAHTDCMANRGYDLDTADTETGATGVSSYLQGRLPDSALDRADPSKEWRDYLQLESDVLEADRECRQDQYYEGLALLDPLLDAFEAEHGAELRDSETRWALLTEEAVAKGFHSQSTR